MFEKVNPSHPDKVADRIAGAIVDLAYRKTKAPRVAIEVLIGHGKAVIMGESSVRLLDKDICRIVQRISEASEVFINIAPQDEILAKNQAEEIRCGDNGIFRGMPVTEEQRKLSWIAKRIYKKYPTDGKYILDGDKLIICQSKADREGLIWAAGSDAIINPLGDWEGGINVDTGATNRKIGSDMADGATGGGLHGKDLSKADVSVNIYAYLKAQETGRPVEISCAIGDTEIDGKPYSEIVETARQYIRDIGGFEKLAEWGLV